MVAVGHRESVSYCPAIIVKRYNLLLYGHYMEVCWIAA